MRGWFILVVVAACYAPRPPRGVPCIPGDDPCPAGQVCAPVGGTFECAPPGGGDVDAFVPDPDVDPDADDDGDGTRNVDDNCPVIANADQANEDGDAFGDACDPCPPFADAVPIADGDGDGVSEACDPFPQRPGDRIAVFETFSAPTTPTGWSTLGNWTFGSGRAAIASGDGDVNYLTIVQPVAARQAVFVKLTVDELKGTGARAVGPSQMFQPNPLRSIACELLRNGSGPQIAIDDTQGPTLAIGASTFDAGQTSIMRNVRDGKDYACDDSAVTLTASTDYTTASPAVGVRTKSVSATVDWVLVVASP